MRYTVKLNKNGVTIVDNQTKKVYPAHLGSCGRTIDGKWVDKFQVVFDAKVVGCENKGVVQIPKQLTKVGDDMTFETDLTNKRNSTSKSALDYLNSLFS